MKLSGAEIVVRTLISHGVDAVFGYPGGQIINVYDAIYQHQDELTHYLTSHEQGASHAADGYARATGKTGVVIATSGPGATNLVTGLATAYLDSTPMVAITGNVPIALIGKDSFQEVDIKGITIPITKHNYIVDDIAELEQILCEAFQIARSGRPGPVLVDIPKNIQIAEYDFNGGTPLEPHSNPEIKMHEVEAAIDLIQKSKRPFIYAGGGVITSGAYKELLDFADRIDAPIGFSMMGLSALEASCSRNLGMTGMHGSYAATKAKSASDLIIAVGVRFSDRATGNKDKYQENRHILHIDIDRAEMGKNITEFTGLLGNIKEALPLLTQRLEQQSLTEWQEEIRQFQKAELAPPSAAEEITPYDLIRYVGSQAPKDTVVVTDVGQHQMWTAQYYPFSAPRTFLTSGGLGTMGFGMGAAIGASVSKGAQKTILFTGDGSFHMNLNELATAVRYNIPLIIIIMNNGVLGMVRQWQSFFFENRYSQTTLERQTDFVKFAESFGAVGYRAFTRAEMQEAVTKALAEEKPVIIDCIIDKDANVFPMIPPNGSFNDIILK